MPLFRSLALATLVVATWSAQAHEATIRTHLSQRLPNLPPIDEVAPTPMPGLWEVRIGHELFYTDPQGNFLIEGQLIDTRERRNLTEERVANLTRIEFASLPLKDAIVWKSGNGRRKIAVFADPNCGFCKRFERDLQAVKDVTVYTFLYPVPIGPDSEAKSRNIWCAKDRLQAWRDWMLNGVPPGAAPQDCDASAVTRTVAMARKYRVTGTPALVFEDGTRIPGALNTRQIEQVLAKVSK